jgi:hypothetical protein
VYQPGQELLAHLTAGVSGWMLALPLSRVAGPREKVNNTVPFLDVMYHIRVSTD